VTVNRAVVTELGVRVEAGRDVVAVDGRVVRRKRKLYLAVNKPVGVVCTREDEQGRPTVLDLLPVEWASNVYPVGRLDRDSEGLIFVTNDGDFCLRITHPRYGVRKLYVATVRGRVGADVPRQLTRGVESSGETLKAERVRLLNANNTRSVLELEMVEGRNREVRRLLQAVGYGVEHLRRVQIGPIRLGTLKLGRWRTLSEGEVASLERRTSGAGSVKETR
jgi:23S rRNA pseudouridine2605 synthase